MLLEMTLAYLPNEEAPCPHIAGCRPRVVVQELRTTPRYGPLEATRGGETLRVEHLGQPKVTKDCFDVFVHKDVGLQALRDYPKRRDIPLPLLDRHGSL